MFLVQGSNKPEGLHLKRRQSRTSQDLGHDQTLPVSRTCFLTKNTLSFGPPPPPPKLVKSIFSSFVRERGFTKLWCSRPFSLFSLEDETRSQHLVKFWVGGWGPKSVVNSIVLVWALRGHSALSTLQYDFQEPQKTNNKLPWCLRIFVKEHKARKKRTRGLANSGDVL